MTAVHQYSWPVSDDKLLANAPAKCDSPVVVVIVVYARASPAVVSSG